MDLGIRGRAALVCASSKGLGRACANALADEGVNLVLTARGEPDLEIAATEIRARYGVTVTAVVCDITTESGRAQALAACPAPDILITNAGGPPFGDFRDWTRDDWIRAIDANMLTPIALIKATLDGMIARRFGRIVNITSAAVKAPIPEIGLSNGARTGLTGFIAGLSRQVAEHNVIINNLLPGHFLTERLQANNVHNAAAAGLPLEVYLENLHRANPTRRFGRPEEFGRYCAFMCSVHAGYIVGQNLLHDGGKFGGTF